jgi:hypothetical protein
VLLVEARGEQHHPGAMNTTDGTLNARDSGALCELLAHPIATRPPDSADR